MNRKLTIALLLLLSLPALATTRYVAQTAGTFSGGTACNGQTAITPVTWNSTAESPGDVSYVCGTINVAAGASGLTPAWSGTSASAITINFDTGAILQSHYFAGSPGSSAGGAILINGYNYITVNGQNTGTIQNTLNGTSGQTCLGGSCTDDQPSVGVWVHNTTGVTIQNLTIQNIYMDKNGLGSGGNAFSTGDIFTDGPNASLTISGNTLKDAHVGAWVSFDNGNTTANIFNNTIAHHGWQISAANGTSSTASATINIYGNDISNWADWNGAGSSGFHTDGIIEYTCSAFSGSACGTNAPTFNPQIYNNYFHGDLDGGTGAGTGYIYCSNNNQGSVTYANSTCTVFNNVIDMSAGGNTNGAAAIWDAGRAAQFYHNTIIGPASLSAGSSAGFVFGGNAAATIENNIFGTLKYIYFDPGPYNATDADAVAASNNNDWYNCLSNCVAMVTSYSTLAAWHTGQGFDSASVTGNPTLTSYVPQTGSAAIGLGANLTSLCSGSLAELCTDKANVARPNSAWDSGAYQYIGATPNPPVISVFALHP